MHVRLDMPGFLRRWRECLEAQARSEPAEVQAKPGEIYADMMALDVAHELQPEGSPGDDSRGRPATTPVHWP
jgi:hypothetical protein